jgi:hypothetical protein
VWKPIPPLIQIESRITAQIVAAIIALALTHTGAAFASCWALNPNGARTCGDYINHGGGVEYLCEDIPGDCGALGYTKVAHPREELPETRVEPRRPAEFRSRGTGELERRKIEAGARARVLEHADIPDRRENATSGNREGGLNPGRLVRAAGVENQIAACLGLTLALAGVFLLPGVERTRLWSLIGRAAWALGLVFLFMLAVFGGGSNRRRRRYY